MPVVRFSGHILPPMPDLSITTAGRWQDDDLGYAIDVFVEIERSVVTVECSIEDFIPLDIMRLLLRATDTVQAVVDLAAFTKGGPFRVHFDAYLKPDGTFGPLKSGDDDLAALCSSVTLGAQSYAEALKIVFEDRNLIAALRDLIEATSFARNVVPHCARAIETLRTLMLPLGVDRRKGWPIIHENLRVTEEYLRLITDESRAPRHGDHQTIPGSVTHEIAKRSWTIMDRYLEFRKRGSQPLPLSEFPLLTG